MPSPSTPTPPTPPDPKVQEANQLKSIQTAQEGSLVNQSNPLETVTYTSTKDPKTGANVYSANTQLTPEQKKIFDTAQGNTLQSGQTASQLLSGVQSQYTKPPNLLDGVDSLLTGPDGMLTHEEQYLQPYFDQQTEQAKAGLAAQGLNPDSPAYQNQMRQMENNQGQQVSGFLASAMPEAFSMAMQNYELPLKNYNDFKSGGDPTNSNALQQNTSAAQISPVNSAGIENQAYTNQMNTYDANNANSAAQSGAMGQMFSLGSQLLPLMM